MHLQIILVLTLLHGGMISSSNEIGDSHITVVHGSCEPGRWYEWSPCQYCYCKRENALSCFRGSYVPSGIRIGNTELILCEMGLKLGINEMTQHDIARTKNIKREGSDSSEEINKPRLQFPKFESNDYKHRGDDDSDDSASAPNENIVPVDEDKSANVVQLEEDKVPPNRHESEEIDDKTRRFFDRDILNVIDTLRKSLLSVKPGNDCVPGTQTSIDNVICFCMKNGKFLCRND